MGIQQSSGSHTKHYIKVPNAIVTFANFPCNNIFKDLQKDIEQIILVSSLEELPSDYWHIVQKLFVFLESCLTVMMENVLLHLPREEWKNAENQVSQLRTQTATLQNEFKTLQLGELSDANREVASADVFEACQGICRLFSDETGFFYDKCFTATPFLVAFAGIYRSFLKLWVRNDNAEDLKLLVTALQNYKEKCINERLDNIKMLRSQSVSYNVHDYSHEAQIRKDVAFGGKINDFYDKRPSDNVTFTEHALKSVDEMDWILTSYKNEVKQEYESFFEILIVPTF